MEPLLTKKEKGYAYSSSLFPDYDGFIIIKPGFLKYSDKIIRELKLRDFIIIEAEEKTLSRKEAERIYNMHKDKLFFKELIDYMTSGACIGMVLLSPFADRESSIETLKELKKKYRRRYGIDDMRNVIHTSDSYQSVVYETEVFFQNVEFN